MAEEHSGIDTIGDGVVVIVVSLVSSQSLNLDFVLPPFHQAKPANCKIHHSS